MDGVLAERREEVREARELIDPEPAVAVALHEPAPPLDESPLGGDDDANATNGTNATAPCASTIVVVATAFKNDDGVPTYQRVRFVDKATGYSTTMEMLSQKIGGDLSNSLFKKRNLVRGQ